MIQPCDKHVSVVEMANIMSEEPDSTASMSLQHDPTDGGLRVDKEIANEDATNGLEPPDRMAEEAHHATPRWSASALFHSDEDDDIQDQPDLRKKHESVIVDTFSSRARPLHFLGVTTMTIAQEWSSQTRRGHLVPLLTVSHNTKQDFDQSIQRTFWMHMTRRTPSLRNLEQTLNFFNIPAISQDRQEVVSSLLTTVRESRERNFALGCFMLPGLTTYQASFTIRKGSIERSHFLSFPYFALASETEYPDVQRLEPGQHPVRTLFQTRYRLSHTKKRDQLQSIRSLRNEETRACASHNLSHMKDEAVYRARLYVPQMWNLLLSEKILVSCTPNPLIELCGNFLSTTWQNVPTNEPAQYLKVLIETKRVNQQEHWFPLRSCECFFGLLSQVKRLAQTLGLEGEDIQLYYMVDDGKKQTLSTSLVWLQMITESTGKHSQAAEIVIKLGHIPFTVQTPERRDVSFLGDNCLTWDNQISQRTKNVELKKKIEDMDEELESLKKLKTEQKYLPFLDWPIREDRERDIAGHSKMLRSRRVLRSISRDLKIQEDVLESLLQQCVKTDSKFTALLRCRSHHELLDKFFPERHGNSNETSAFTARTTYTVAKVLLAQADIFLSFYLPREIFENSQASERLYQGSYTVRLYWHMIILLLANILRERVKDDKSSLYMINIVGTAIELAKELNQGMWRVNTCRSSTTFIDASYVEAEVTLGFIPDTLRAMISLLFEANKILSDSAIDRHTRERHFKSTMDSYYPDLLRTFRNARHGLIQDLGMHSSHAFFPDLESVVTPERITILLLKRLSQGVSGLETFDIMELYARIVEKLASQVGDRSSQFVLSEIDQVGEELDIVLEILNQQKAFIQNFASNLNPDNIVKPTMTRRARYEYEKPSLLRLVADIEERQRDCLELQVQIEKLCTRHARNSQDENNRKLMLFTVVTITFLPLTFISGFFGMNLKGIDDTQYDIRHFWMVAIPFTIGVFTISLVTLYWRLLLGRISDLTEFYHDQFRPKDVFQSQNLQHQVRDV